MIEMHHKSFVDIPHRSVVSSFKFPIHSIRSFVRIHCTSILQFWFKWFARNYFPLWISFQPRVSPFKQHTRNTFVSKHLKFVKIMNSLCSFAPLNINTKIASKSIHKNFVFHLHSIRFSNWKIWWEIIGLLQSFPHGSIVLLTSRVY